MNKDEPRVSIVFVNWNNKKYTFNLIESLKKINYDNYDIILVDNGSSDGTQGEFKKKYSKVAHIIENDSNLGLAEGTNVGIREALKRGSKYVLIMNNDMLVDKYFLNFLVESMEKSPEVAVSTPLIYYTNPKNIIWCAGCKYTLRGFVPLQQGEFDNYNAKKNVFVDGCDCVLMIRSSALNNVGLLDKTFFLMHEFTEWCLRATNKNYKCLHVPKSKIWHEVSVSMKNLKKESSISLYYNIRNWLLTIKKNKPSYYFLFILLLESTLLAIYRFVGHLRKKQVGLIKTYYIAIWHALINKTSSRIYSKNE